MRYWLNGGDEDYDRDVKRVSRCGESEAKPELLTMMSATQTHEELEQALEILKRVGKRMGILP